MRKSLLGLAGAAAVCSCIAACVPRAEEQRAQAKHVVLIVWDGMRADFVTEEHTPNLWKMGQEGVVFRRHHSVYPTATNVNGTAMATGVFPARSGVIANQEYRPAIDAENAVDTAVSRNIRKGDEASGGRYLAVPTVPEILQRSGRRTAVAGTKWITTLFNRQRVGAAEGNQVVVDGKAWPEATQRALDSLGDYPEKTLPNNGQDRWTTDALTESLWKDGVPDFSLLWLSDPDFTAHAIAPGSPEALSAIRHSDAMLGRVLQALEAKGVRAQTDVFVVSDHGFSTIERAHDVPALLREAGFRAAKKFEGEAAPGSILVAGNAGTTLFYVIGRDEAITRRLVEWLQQSDFAGVIFTREEMEGTFAIGDVHLAKADGPDVVMAFRWNDKPNQFGTPGMIMADWNRAAGKGTHATLSAFDVHNTLVAAGPDFRRGHASEVPSGNIDLAATILHILGVTPPEPLDGRVLREAMTWGSAEAPEVREETVRAERLIGTGTWKQYLKLSRVGKHSYIDEGNGAFSTAAIQGGVIPPRLDQSERSP